jgi:hypothetical protein
VRKLLPLLILCWASLSFGQGSLSSGVAQSSTGQALAGVSVATCFGFDPGTSPTPCASLATTYTDITLAVPCTINAGTQAPVSGTGCTNPGLTDGFGNYTVYSSPGTYYQQVYGYGIVTPFDRAVIFPASGSGATGGSTGSVQAKNQVGAFAGETPCYADLQVGSDIGAQINACYNNGPSTGVYIRVPSFGAVYSFSTPIVFGTLGKPVWLECDPGITILNYTPSSGTAITLSYGGAQLSPITTQSHPGIYGCGLRGPGGTAGTIGSWGTTIGIADGPNFFAQSVIEGVTVQGFNAGIQFNSNSSFLDTIQMCDIGFNNVGINITNGANNTENQRINFNNISNNNYGVQFGSIVGGGDWYIDNNSFDGNNIVALFTAAAGGGSQFLHVTFNENHVEDVGGAFQDLIQINGGLVDMVGDTFVIDHLPATVCGSAGTPCGEVVDASTSTVDMRDILMHSNSIFNNFVKFTGGANGNIGTVAANGGEFPNGVYTATGGGNICSYGINPISGMSCQNSTATAMTLMYTTGAIAQLTSGIGATGIQLLAGSLGMEIGGHLGQTATGQYGGACSMVSATTCTVTIGQAYQVSPICIVAPQNAGAAATYSTAGAYCVASGTTITITAGASNSGNWAAVLVGNPN